jgi:Xaa-Pro aminopeptidase
MNMPDKQEFAVKLKRLRAFLKKGGYDAALMGTAANFSWLSCGGKNKVLLSTDYGVSVLLVTQERLVCVANTMDARRLAEQELAGLGFELESLKWYAEPVAARAQKLTGRGRLLADMPLPGEVAGAEVNFQKFYAVHYPLTDPEILRYRAMGRDAEEVMRRVADQTRPGLSGLDVETLLLTEFAAKKLNVTCLIVGSDEEIWNYRHPLPSPKKIEKQLMLVLAVERHGLNVPITRMVWFGGEPPAETARRFQAVTNIAARTIAACRPGVRFADLLARQKGWYAVEGFAEETENHFMGGITGYIPNDSSLCLDDSAVIQERQAFNWFITITGANTEDTMITTERGPELLTCTGRWPLKRIEVEGLKLELPQVLVK